jgi:hypothetical protein
MQNITPLCILPNFILFYFWVGIFIQLFNDTSFSLYFMNYFGGGSSFYGWKYMYSFIWQNHLVYLHIILFLKALDCPSFLLATH